MKALAIKQPWAEAITDGIKDIENRSWQTAFRGPVLIHASKAFDEDEETAYYDLVIRRGIKPLDKGSAGRLLRLVDRAAERCGGIVGVAEIVDCVSSSESAWFVGEFGFVLANARAIDLIPCRGMLGFFDPPPDVVKAALAQIQGGA